MQLGVGRMRGLIVGSLCLLLLSSASASTDSRSFSSHGDPLNHTHAKSQNHGSVPQHKDSAAATHHTQAATKAAPAAQTVGGSRSVLDGDATPKQHKTAPTTKAAPAAQVAASLPASDALSRPPKPHPHPTKAHHHPPPPPDDEPTPVMALMVLVLVTLFPLACAIAVYATMLYPSLVFKAFIVVSFFALNSGLSLLNRWALGFHGFKMPLAMTALHMLFGAFSLSPIMLLKASYRDAHREILRRNGRALFAMGIINALQIAANNASMQTIELSLNQVIRAFGPVLVSLIAVVVEGKWTTPLQTVTLIAVSCGVGLTVFKTAEGQFVGMVLTFISIALQSLIISMSAWLMAGQKLDGFQMAFYIGPVGFCFLFPFALRTEAGVLLHALATEPVTCLGFLLGGSVLAVAYNVVVFQSSHTLSSVGTALLANLKIVLLVMLSAIFLGEMSNWIARQVIGMVLTLGGTMAYSWLKHNKM